MKTVLLAIAFSASALVGYIGPVAADDKASIDTEVKSALTQLYDTNPGAKAVGEKAKAILVFPTIRRAGFVVGGQRGDGALIKGGKIVSYWSSGGISVGLEAGAQKYSYALFFMTDKALNEFENRDSYEIGAGANVVFVDAGAAAAGGSASAPADVLGYVFSQSGLMGGVSLQGTKLTKTGGPAK
jgi:lipid-binding SYLF domain-containing protein